MNNNEMDANDMIPIKVVLTITLTGELDPNDYPTATTIEEKLKLFKEDVEYNPTAFIDIDADTIEVVVTREG